MRQFTGSLGFAIAIGEELRPKRHAMRYDEWRSNRGVTRSLAFASEFELQDFNRGLPVGGSNCLEAVSGPLLLQLRCN